ncbi:hypothetical protein H696_02993 [Fonticula alba]|uniref:Ras-GEF domain-containing protein n=1 Tax=Fonticula alba TaxID=691883 RepID=A0A058Z961_FONAL|nr:hypothetical protein H696_02993 [Fonticula alba]KCV70636.1 hypothetical protein H696_02993 [Fonticula alba]|eukprot:XP_009495152.1 hypothetical protein H696_02993 [Fonticula alba]
MSSRRRSANSPNNGAYLTVADRKNSDKNRQKNLFNNDTSAISIFGGDHPINNFAPSQKMIDIKSIDEEQLRILIDGRTFDAGYLPHKHTTPIEVQIYIRPRSLCVLDKKSQVVLDEFDLTRILQYSFNPTQSTFSLYYMSNDDGSRCDRYVFRSEHYFAIHEFLNIVIQLVLQSQQAMVPDGAQPAAGSGADAEGGVAQAEGAQPNDGSGAVTAVAAAADPKLTDEAGSFFPPAGDMPVPAASSAAESAESGANRLLAIFDPPPSTPTSPDGGSGATPAAPTGDSEAAKSKLVSDATLQRSQKTKDYFETRYRNQDPSAVRGSLLKDRMLSGGSTAPESPGALQPPLPRESTEPEHQSTPGSQGGSTGKKAGSLRLQGLLLDWGTMRQRKPRPVTGEGTDSGKYGVPPAPPTAGSPGSGRGSAIGNLYNPSSMEEITNRFDKNGKVILNRRMIENRYQVSTGTLEGLIDYLADLNSPDSMFINDFLQSFRNFMTPTALFERLTNRFWMPGVVISTDPAPSKQSTLGKKDKKPGEPEVDVAICLDAGTVITKDVQELIRFRVLSVIKKWVDRHWYDFENLELLRLLRTFVTEISDHGFGVVAEQINIKINGIPRLRSEMMREADLSFGKIVNLDLFSVTPKELARHLTMVSIAKFNRIIPDEFAILLWGSKEERVTMTPNLTHFINRFNDIGYWVATELCRVEDLRRRAQLMEMFIQVARYCLKYQNFNDLIAILSGLQTIPIYRLRKTWAALSQRSLNLFRELEAKVSPDNNYKAYRTLEYSAPTPRIPFFGLCLKDLTFMNDGNQTILVNGMINFEKYLLVMGKIMEIRVSQESNYNFPKNESLMAYCDLLLHESEDELTDKSYVLEPSTRPMRRVSVSSVSSSQSTASDATTVAPSIYSATDAYPGSDDTSASSVILSSSASSISSVTSSPASGAPAPISSAAANQAAGADDLSSSLSSMSLRGADTSSVDGGASILGTSDSSTGAW